MSTTPGTNPAQNNTPLLLMGGVVVGIVVLCGGMFVMALVTLQVVNKNAMGTYAGIGTQSMSGGTPASSAGTVDEGKPAHKVANDFMMHLRNGKLGDAYQLTSNGFQNTTSQEEFRKDIESDKLFRGFTQTSLSRMTGSTSDIVKFRGSVTGANGMARFALNVKEEDDGSWKVDSFGRE